MIKLSNHLLSSANGPDIVGIVLIVVEHEAIPHIDEAREVRIVRVLEYPGYGKV